MPWQAILLIWFFPKPYIAGLGSFFQTNNSPDCPQIIADSMDIAAYLARIMFPAFIFISISYIATVVLQSHESFAIPSMVSIPSI